MYRFEESVNKATKHVGVQMGILGLNCYAAVIQDDTLSPDYRRGDVVVCDPDQPPARGDVVIVWWRGEEARADIKKLTLAIPPCAVWGLGDNISAQLVCEQLTPPRQFSASLTEIEAVHKVITKLDEQHKPVPVAAA